MAPKLLSTQSPHKGRQTENPAARASERPVEYKSAEENILRSLNKYRIEDFKVLYPDMTFEWGDRPNRAVSTPEKMSQLFDSMARGLHRIDPQHRMSGIIDPALLTGCMKIVDDDQGELRDVTLQEISELNKEVLFPTVLFGKPKGVPKKPQIEMQSGQG